MATISLLPHLESLYLDYKSVIGAEWICVEEKLCCLKHLQIRNCDYLVQWRAQ